ncbi:hypothetical protein CN082_04720 [Sinorhizobium meliloti]|uniref:hypothetical protein n=1 Tax=Rhizobium meliloti TaxID=382 RepID=UPI000FD7A97B|nr:hypothetical protein [Sinorhizobium meliloti]MDX0424491.1 hypothetical protein [Sinorhizobium medicae]RVP32312.1 hypothetical protein CN082_04720 [Sinorhizobium meliloti]
MTSDAKTIPDDVMKAVQSAWEKAWSKTGVTNAETIRDAIAIGILAERARNAQPRRQIIKAICELPHSIDDDRVEFRFSPRRPGHNALNQLITQLEGLFGTSHEEA